MILDQLSNPSITTTYFSTSQQRLPCVLPHPMAVYLSLPNTDGALGTAEQLTHLLGA